MLAVWERLSDGAGAIQELSWNFARGFERRSGSTGRTIRPLILPSSPLRKNISLRISPKSVAYPPPSRPDKGAFRDRHGREAGCGGRGRR